MECEEYGTMMLVSVGMASAVGRFWVGRCFFSGSPFGVAVSRSGWHSIFKIEWFGCQVIFWIFADS